MAQAGAESIDAAREEWWVGLRDAEEETYRAQGRDFRADEAAYRSGFESALNAKTARQEYDDVSSELDQQLCEPRALSRLSEPDTNAARPINDRSEKSIQG